MATPALMRSMAVKFGLLLAMAALLTGCRAVEFVFKAGVWTALVAIGLFALLVFGAGRGLRRYRANRNLSPASNDARPGSGGPS